MDTPNIPDTNPALQPLQVLVGTWGANVEGQTWQETIAWLEGSYLAWRSERKGEFPGSFLIIGRNENAPGDNYSMFYYDDRGISRIYQMTFSGGVLKLWREDADFYQRFEGKLSDNQNVLTGYWETSTNGGQDWKHDFNITYTRSEG